MLFFHPFPTIKLFQMYNNLEKLQLRDFATQFLRLSYILWIFTQKL